MPGALASGDIKKFEFILLKYQFDYNDIKGVICDIIHEAFKSSVSEDPRIDWTSCDMNFKSLEECIY